MSKPIAENLKLTLLPGTAASIRKLLLEAGRYGDNTTETESSFIATAIKREIVRRNTLRRLVDRAVKAGDANAANDDLQEWWADMGEEYGMYVVMTADEIINPKSEDDDE